MKKLYLVETVSMFRIRYAVEAECADYAKDTVTCNEAQELSQLHLDEIITSAREITDAEYLKIFDEDNDYLKNWDEDQKRRMISRTE